MELTIPLADSLLATYDNIGSMSFDKGFYSKGNKELLCTAVPKVLPKKGKKNASEKEEESEKGFKKLRNMHSGVESNINQLESNGLDRCLDKGLRNYKRYVSLGILSYNLHRLGKIVLEAQAEKPLGKQPEPLTPKKLLSTGGVRPAGSKNQQEGLFLQVRTKEKEHGGAKESST